MLSPQVAGKFRFDALKDKVYTTTDVEVSKSTTSNNLSFLLTAVLDNQNNELLGGMSGTLTTHFLVIQQ